MTTYQKATSPDDFFTNFLSHPTKIEGQPNYDDLRALRETLYRNAASVPSTRGGGAHGHLGMLMEPATYATLVPGHAFDAPVPPEPLNYNGMTAAQIAATNRQYSNDRKEYQEYLHIGQAINKQISRTLEPLYLAPVEDPILGMVGLEPRTILA
jgi:hypothetical protein